MNIIDMFNLGSKFMAEGNMPMAVQMWQEVIKADNSYGPAHYNMAGFLRQQNNVMAEREEINKFLDCPVTGRTIKLIQVAEARLVEIENQLKAQPK